MYNARRHGWLSLYIMTPVCCRHLCTPCSRGVGRYSAGTMPWGGAGHSFGQFEPQRQDDNLLEVIGFTATSLVRKCTCTLLLYRCCLRLVATPTISNFLCNFIYIFRRLCVHACNDVNQSSRTRHCCVIVCASSSSLAGDAAGGRTRRASGAVSPCQADYVQDHSHAS